MPPAETETETETEPETESETPVENQPQSVGIDATTDKPESSATNAAGSVTGAISSAKRVRRWWFIGGLIFAVAGVIIPLLFFLMLFKSVHIKNLFIDSQFAKFDRAFSRSIQKAVNESKAAGTEAEVPADADPVAQLEGVSAEEMNKLKNDPQALTDETAKARALEQANVGPDSVGAAIDEEFGITRDIPPEDPKLSQKDGQKAITDEMNKEVTGSGNEVSAPDPIKDAVAAAKAEADAGASLETIKTDAVKNVAKKLGGPIGKAGAALFIATFACIAEDIYSSSAKLFTQIKLASLARFASSISKHADCLQLGKCNLNDAAAVSAIFDSGGQSFTKSAGYQRASKKTVTAAGTDNDLPDAMRPTSTGSGLPSELLSIANKISAVGSAPCSVILNPIFQVSATIGLIGAQIVLIVSGVADFGLSDVVAAVISGASQFLATKIGSALAVDAVLHYSGLIFHGTPSPIEAGNMMDAGSKVLANASLTKSGGRQLSGAENQTLAEAINRDQADYARKQGIAYQLFSPSNPASVAGVLVDQMPTTVHSVFASISTGLAAFISPAKFMSKLPMFGFTQPAYAAAGVESNTYGIPDIGIPDSVIDKWTIEYNTTWVKNNILSSTDTKAKYDKCFDTPMADRLTTPDLDYCNDPNDLTLQHYMAYKIEQAATHALVYLNNSASNDGSTIPTNPPTNGGGGATSCGTAQQCAQKILASNRISYDPDAKADMQATANGTPISACGLNGPLNATMLSVLLTASQKYELKITVFDSGHHCGTTLHAVGKAFDVDSINNIDSDMLANPSVKPLDQQFAQYVATLLPNGGGIGQKECMGDLGFPSTINYFDDVCNHVHVDIGSKAP